MQNLLQLIHKFSSFIVFILLEVAAFMLIVYNSAYPKSTVLSTCNSIVAWHYEVENNIVSYFHLKEANEQLQQENAMLRNQIVLYANERERYKESENVYRYANLQHRFIPAKVIQMNMGGMKNYMTINKGERDGIQAEMGVIGPIGIIGIVSTVGKHFSLVIPVTTSLNFGVSCRLQKNSKLGTLKWDGKDEKHLVKPAVLGRLDLRRAPDADQLEEGHQQQGDAPQQRHEPRAAFHELVVLDPQRQEQERAGDFHHDEGHRQRAQTVFLAAGGKDAQGQDQQRGARADDSGEPFDVVERRSKFFHLLNTRFQKRSLFRERNRDQHINPLS